MEILFLLIPLSAVLILAIIAIFGWAVNSGQFDDLEREGQRLLQDEKDAFDAGQGSGQEAAEQSQGRAGAPRSTSAARKEGDPA